MAVNLQINAHLSAYVYKSDIMDFYKALEIIGMIVALGYLFSIIKQKTWCWPLGIVGSFITIFLYFHAKLYLESILNVYYVWAGIYGWIYWKKGKNESQTAVPVTEWTMRTHLIAIVICILLYAILAPLMRKYTDSPRPHIDTILAVFSFLATFLEARKVLSAWLYWFVINGVSIWIQIDRGLNFYAVISVFYTIMCIPGYLQWRKSYLADSMT